MAEERLILDFWDVSQGDGTVIRLPDEQLVLIDVGPRGSPIIDWLTDQKASIRAVIITHNDEDHAGSLPSLIKIPGKEIQTVYMLVDREKQSSKFQNIWRPVREEEKKGRCSVIGLSRDTVIWQGAQTSLKVVYPSFSENIEANQPNETSAVVCLFYEGAALVIWPGDAPMQIIATHCAGAMPHLLHGPHHGGPVDRKKARFSSWVEAVTPERVFVSVGTNNRYSLPAENYLRLQAARGCRVACTELTKHCDNSHVTNKEPILQTAALLGLRATRQGVSCRGCFRAVVRDGTLTPDAWDTEHLNRVRMLRRPLCLPNH